MSFGIIEKQVLYDNPYAPIVKFDEEDDMSNDQLTTQSNVSLIEHSISLEDLVQSFDNTINSCFSEQTIIESKQISSNTDLLTTSKFVAVIGFFSSSLSYYLFIFIVVHGQI